MNNNPLEIIDEFLDSQNPQLRRNALTALASLHDSGAIKRMVQTALEDKDASVRSRAEDELAKLDEQSQAMLAKEFNVRIRMEDKSEGQRAYALLGRLRARGLRLDLENLTWLQGFNLEFSLFKLVYPDRGRKFYLRSCVPAMKAALFSLAGYSVFFFLLWFRIHEDLSLSWDLVKNNQIFFEIWGVLLIPPVLVPLITFRASALDLHTNRYKGALIELMWAGLGGLVLTLVVLWLSSRSDFDVSIILAIIAVRLGCLLSRGVEFDYGPKYLAQTLSGTIAGTLVLLVAAAFDFNGDSGIMNNNWMLYMVIIIPALANSYSVIDIKDASRLRRPESYSRWTAYGLPAIAIILIALAFFPEPPCTAGNIQANLDLTSPVVIAQVPYCRNLVINPNQKAGIDVNFLKSAQPQDAPLKPSQYALRVSGKNSDVSTNDDIPNNEIDLDPGSYTLVFARNSSALVYKKIDSANAMPILLDHYWNVLGQHGIKLNPPVNLNIKFSSIPPKT